MDGVRRVHDFGGYDWFNFIFSVIMESKERLLEELHVAELMVMENPCRMPDSVLGALRVAIKGVMGVHFMKGASRDQVASYLERDVRTLGRWAHQFPDFPKARHEGHLEVSYNWMDVVRWKMRHSELYLRAK